MGYGLRGSKDFSVFIIYPIGKDSQVQEAQMTTLKDEYIIFSGILMLRLCVSLNLSLYRHRF
jgi:threonine synthase